MANTKERGCLISLRLYLILPVTKFLRLCKESLWWLAWKRRLPDPMTKAKKKFIIALPDSDTFSSLMRSQVSWFVMLRRHFFASCVLFVATFFSYLAQAQKTVHPDGFRVIHTYPHDPDAFTQGLIYVDGHLYESTGRNGKSSIRLVDLSTGKVLQHYDLAAKYFGEGLTDWDSELVQITWQTEIGFVYDKFSFSLKRTFHYSGEGWGLTHDDKELILSDGTPVIRFLDPQSFVEIRRGLES